MKRKYMTSPEGTDLLDALRGCTDWRRDGGLYVGRTHGWMVVLGHNFDSIVGGASNEELGVEIRLPQAIAQAWLSVARRWCAS